MPKNDVTIGAREKDGHDMKKHCLVCLLQITIKQTKMKTKDKRTLQSAEMKANC